jgi:hypothetical protein
MKCPYQEYIDCDEEMLEEYPDACDFCPIGNAFFDWGDVE